MLSKSMAKMHDAALNKDLSRHGSAAGVSDGALTIISGKATVSLNCKDESSLLEAVRTRFSEKSGFCIATVNLDHLVKLRRNEQFRAAYGGQDFVVADGYPIIWLSRIFGRPVSLVPGSDLILPLVQTAARAEQSIALVGATPDTLERAARALEERIPGVSIVKTISPSQGFDPFGAEADAIVASLAASGAGLTLLALGAPTQEIFAVRAKEQNPAMGFASIGAGLDFIAGTKRRAPRWLRQLALEWFWRVLMEPRRLAYRYTLCALVFPRVVIETLAHRR